MCADELRRKGQGQGLGRGKERGTEGGIKDPVHFQIKFVMPGIRWARSQRLIRLIKL